MKRSEVFLLIATIIVMGLGLYMTFFGEEEGGGSGGAAMLASGDLTAAQARFKENLRTMKKAPEINKAYNMLSVGLEDNRDPRADPGMAATGQLYKVLTEKLGVSTPNISNAREVAIKGVEDHHFINISFKVNGSEAEMKRLLYDIERLGFLIQSFRLGGNRGGQVEYLDMDVVVSKLVKGKLKRPGSRR